MKCLIATQANGLFWGSNRTFYACVPLSCVLHGHLFQQRAGFLRHRLGDVERRVASDSRWMALEQRLRGREITISTNMERKKKQHHQKSDETGEGTPRWAWAGRRGSIGRRRTEHLKQQWWRRWRSCCSSWNCCPCECVSKNGKHYLGGGSLQFLKTSLEWLNQEGFKKIK